MRFHHRLKRSREPATVVPFGIGRAEFTWVVELDSLVYELVGLGELDDDTLDLLSQGGDRILPYSVKELSEDDLVTARTAAAIGYYTRTAEITRHPDACKFTTDEDAQRFLKSVADACHLDVNSVRPLVDCAPAASRLALLEAVDSPNHATEPARYLPGMAADQRPRLRDRTLLNCVRPGLDGVLVSPAGRVQRLTLEDLRRLWSFGYFLRALHDLEAERRAGGYA